MSILFCKDNNFHGLSYHFKKIIIFASIKFNNANGTSQFCKDR